MMADPDRERAKELFQHAAGLEPAERVRYLDAHCDDEKLRARVERLLAHDAHGMEGFLEGPAAMHSEVTRETGPSVDALPATIGRYRLLRKIGAGGMGEVYEAEQDHPCRIVALKTIRPGLASDELRRRFRTEVEVLGQLHHPGIAQVHDAGVIETPAGPLHFFAMERIDGVPLTEYADSRRLDTRQRLDLLARVCDAVEYAHRRGVIHRDLKPANILIDADGQPKILDFGVARVTDADIQTTTLHTSAGQLIGTLAYMSPEQAAGDSKEIDPRSDVYALGVVAYELLCGKLPLDVGGKSIAEAVRLILDEDPRRLSTVRRVLSGDVDTIVSKALEKEKPRRYASASDLGSDIRRFLDSEPIRARPPSALYQLRKLAARHRGLVAGLAATFLTLVAGIIVATRLAMEEAAQRGIADEQTRAARAEAYHANIVAASAALESHRVNTAARHLDRAPEEYRGWEWRHLDSLLDQSLLVIDHASPVNDVVFLDDGAQLVTGTDDGKVRLWDAASGELVLTILDQRVAVGQLAYSPTGRWLAAGTRDGMLRVWDVGSWDEPRWTIKNENRCDRIAASPDGTLLAHDCPYNRRVSETHVRDSETGELVRRWPSPVFALAFSPDAATLAVAVAGASDGARAGRIVRFETQTGRALGAELAGHRYWIQDLVYTGDGSSIISASLDETVRVWDTATGESEVLTGHDAGVTSLALSSAGTLIASGSRDHTVRLWDLSPEERQSRVLGGHDAAVQAVSFHPDGRRLASASTDGTVRIWAIESPTVVLSESDHFQGHYECAFSPDGDIVVTTPSDGAALRVWDREAGEEIGALELPERVRSVDFSPDGERLAVASQRLVSVRDAATFEELIRVRPERVIYVVRFSQDGETLALGSSLRLELWDARTGEHRHTLPFEGQSVQSLAFSPDGTLLAAEGLDRAVKVWDTVTLEAVFTVEAGDQAFDRTTLYPRSVAFSRDGRELAAVAREHAVWRWEVGTWKPLPPLVGHHGAVIAIDYSPDGRRIVTSGRDGFITLWHRESGQPMVELRGHEGQIRFVQFSPDGEDLASSGRRRARLWGTMSLKERLARREAAHALNARAGPIVDALFAELEAPARVAARLREDAMPQDALMPEDAVPEDDLRRAARRAVLRRSLRAR